ncbi:MAG TPA: hypothetical protein VJ553_02570 [Candidatus Paceibacterota bacterium]|nr:hypothetical protein [Candidatus Paceibacterota bacterium]
MSDMQERAQRLLQLLIDLPADRFTCGELLFISNRFRYNPLTPSPSGTGDLKAADLEWLERIARRLVKNYVPHVH